MSAPLINSIGWTLLHFVWQGALIGLATALALAVLRRAQPGQRYIVATIGLLACLLWPSAELALRLQGPAMVTEQMRFADALLVRSVNGASGGMLALLQSQLSVIVTFWGACAAVLALRMACGLLWIERRARHPRSDVHWQAVASRMADSFGITRAVRLRVVDTLDSPLTAGWRYPLILLPASLISGMPAELLEALLAHEMAHIKRGDYLVNLGQNLIEIVLFYHPAVWWISGRIRVEREQIADDLAMRHTGQPRQLALALSELERTRFARHQPALAANGGHLLARVQRLVRPDTRTLHWKAAVPLFTLAIAALGAYASAAAHAPQMDRLIVDRAPVVRFDSCAKPQYPAADVAAGHTGTVTLDFQIGTDGSVLDARVARTSGHAGLDQAARDAIRRCQFVPGMADGTPVATSLTMQYVWTLE